MNVGPYDARAPVRGLGVSFAPPLPSTSSASCPARMPTAPSAASSFQPPPYHQAANPATSSPNAPSSSPAAPALPPRPGQLQANRMTHHSPMVGQSYGASMRPAYGYGSAYPSSYGYGQGYGRGFSSAGYGPMGSYSTGFGSPGDGPIENR